MKRSIRGFVVGLIAGLVISCIWVGAVTGVVIKELHYNDIKVTPDKILIGGPEFVAETVIFKP